MKLWETTFCCVSSASKRNVPNTGNNFLLCEQCIQAERSEYTRFSMLEKEMRVLMDEHFLFRYMDSGG